MYRSITTVKGDLAQSEFGITGKDIVWAVVGTGVDAKHPHFEPFKNLELPKGLRHLDFSGFDRDRFEWDPWGEPLDSIPDDFTLSEPVDPLGQGTGVAGLIAGRSYEEKQLMRGLAPEAKILSIRVLDDSGAGDEHKIVAGLQAIQHLNEGEQGLRIHGIIVSIYMEWNVANYACGNSPVCAQIDRLVNSGVVVVVPVGDQAFIRDGSYSKEGGIPDPGNAELAITVGATHRTAPKIYGVSYFSSRGPTADGRRKPDLLAPGEKITVCCNVAQGDLYWMRDGTLWAAAHVAGAAAALMSAQPGLIGKPKQVKDILLRTATDLGREATYQGAGLLDVAAAVRESVGDPRRAIERPLKVFISYSHQDKALWAELRAHLSPLERARLIEVWFDQLIEPGQKWEEEIFKRLNEADIVLLLVSAFFVASDFCYSRELKEAMERQESAGTKVIPIRCRPVTLLGTPLADLQALPEEAKPITSFSDPHEGWAQVTEKLYKVVAGMREAAAP